MPDRRQVEQEFFNIPPIKTWSGLLTVLSIVAALVSAVNWSIAWFDTHIQKVSTTTEQLASIRAEFKADIERLKEDDKKRDLDNKRRDAWALVNQLEIKSLVIQFRLNECQIKSDERKPTAMERQICDQYRQEKEDAVARYKEAWREAMSIGKQQK